MTKQNEIELDGILLHVEGHRLKLAMPASRFEPLDEDTGQVAINLHADQARQLMELMANVMAKEFNSRQAYRVPVRKSYGLEAKIIDGTNEFDVTVKTISMTGIFVAFPVGPKPIFHVNDQFDTQLQFEGNEVRLPATVKRVRQEGVGLFFDNSIQDEEIEPPEDLARMVMALQRKWINCRLQ